MGEGEQGEGMQGQAQMYGKGRQGRPMTLLYSVSKAIRFQMQEQN